jgi:hypothetical protein
MQIDQLTTASPRRRLRSTLAIAALMLLAVGCGSTQNSTAGASRSHPGTGLATAAFKYSRCMRDHGVPSFPDPQVSSDHNGQQTLRLVVPASEGRTPQFKSADTACRGILPAPRNGGPTGHSEQARLADDLSFARCMRNHGVENFPDPTAQGQLTLEMVSGAGVDLHAPSVRSAALACVPASHGALTKAAVERALASPQQGSG